MTMVINSVDCCAKAVVLRPLIRVLWWWLKPVAGLTLVLSLGILAGACGRRPVAGDPSMLTGSESVAVSSGVKAPVGRQVYETTAAGLVLPVITKRVALIKPEDRHGPSTVGTIVVEAVLRADGVISEVQILRTTIKDRTWVEAQVSAALKQWAFRPGRLDGRTVDVRMMLLLSAFE